MNVFPSLSRLFAASLCLVALGGALPAGASVKEVRLGVKGATCATCAFALRKTFQKLDGVSGAKLILKPAFMHVTMKSGEWPDLAKMQESIRLAGFESVKEQVELVVTGTLEKDGDEFVLALDGMKTSVRLPVRVATTGKAPDLVASVGKPVQLEGRWKQSESSAPGDGVLSVTALRSSR